MSDHDTGSAFGPPSSLTGQPTALGADPRAIIPPENRHAGSARDRRPLCDMGIKRGASKIPCRLYYAHDGPCVPIERKVKR